MIAPGGQAGGQPPQQGGGRTFGGPGGRGSTTLDKADVGADWPLIRFLLDDPVYKAAYMGYLERTGAELLQVDQLTAKYRALAALLAPYAAKESDAATYEAAVQQLIDKTAERATAIADFLATQ